jgi:hypothetical protein
VRLDLRIGNQHASLLRRRRCQAEVIEFHLQAELARSQPVRQEFLALDARAMGAVGMEERRRGAGRIDEPLAQRKRPARHADQLALIDLQASMEGLERGQSGVDIRCVQPARQFDDGDFHSSRPECLL